MEESNGRVKKIYRVTVLGSMVNLGLSLCKFAAGVLGHSAAMIADAVHSLSDLITDVVVVVFVKIANKPQDHNHQYGHGKFETFATLIIGFVLLSVGLLVAYDGISKVVAVAGGEVLPSPGMIALIAALVSIVAKELLYRYTVACGRKFNSGAVVANAWHHRSDVFSSLGTAIGIGGAIFLGSRWTVLDPIAAIVVSFFIVKVALELMKPAVDELMERSLPEEVEREIAETACGFDGVSDMHNLRTRKIGAGYAIEFHIRMDGDTPLGRAHAKATLIESELRRRFGLHTHVIIHVEPLKGPVVPDIVDQE